MWRKKLTHSINTSLGKLKEIKLDTYKNDISTQYEYWRFLRVQEHILEDEAEIGDLVLCQTKKKFTMGSPGIDKIGIIVKLNLDQNSSVSEMYILTAGDTVQNPIYFLPWNQFRIEKSLHYTDMWYRHLYVERSQDFMMKCENFI